jgi:hypothetical protein
VNETLRKNAHPLAIQVFDRLLSTLPLAYNEILLKAETQLLTYSLNTNDATNTALYISANRECRNNHEAMHSRFCKDLEQAINTLFIVKEKSNASTSNYDISQLSILDNDDLHGKIALQKMTSSASKNMLINLDIIDDGLATLVTNTKITSTNNPFSLGVIADLIFTSFSHVNIESRPKLMIYHLFRDLVPELLAPFYQEVADLLIEKGYASRPLITEQESAEPNRARRNLDDATSPTATQSFDNNAAIEAALSQNDFSVLAQMLSNAAIPASLINASNSQSQQLYQPPNDIDSNASVVTVSNQDVDSMLAAVQESLEKDTATPINEQLSQQLRANSSGDMYKVISRKAENNINLVSLLFEFLVENARIFPQALNHIMRLQIPFMRLALKSPTLFSGNNHSARRLLNKLADIGATVNNVNDRAYQVIAEITGCIYVQPELTEDIFDELNEELDTFIKEDIERSKEDSIRIAAEAKELQQMAYGTAEDFLQSRLSNVESKLIFHSLLERLWCELLSRCIIQNGMPKQYLSMELDSDSKKSDEVIFTSEKTNEKSEPKDTDEWSELVALFDWIIWSIQAGSNQEDKSRLLNTLATNIKRITTIFKKYEIDIGFSSHFMDQIRSIHLKVIKEKVGTIIDDNQLELNDETQLLLEEIDETKKDDNDKNLIDLVIGRDHQNISQPSSQLTATAINNQGAEETKLEMKSSIEQRNNGDENNVLTTNSTTDVEKTKPTTKPLIAETKHLEIKDIILQVDRLRAGNWLEYLVDAKPTRAKIAFYASYNEKFIFVDRQGHKLFERFRSELIVDIKDGYASVLDTTDTFDKALSHVIGSIRNQQASISP